MSKQSNDAQGWFLSALLLLFVALKLTGHITWSWWWVLSPIWVPLLLMLTVFGFVLGAGVLIDAYKSYKRDKTCRLKK